MIQLARKMKQSTEMWLDKGLRIAGRHLSENVPAGARIIAEKESHIYCGYYDTTPFNADNSKLLALRIVGDNVSPHDSETKADLGYHDLAESRFIKIAESAAWNWQQGCRLQWLPHTDESIIYNDFRNGSFVAITEGRIYPRPIYAISTDGAFALTLDFTRLHRYRRGYGYHNLPAPENSAPDDDGLWHMDMQSGESILLVSLARLAAFKPQDSMSSAYHYINHLQWAPDGKAIVFFHLWHRDGKKKNSRLMILRDGTLSTLDSIRPSHTGWAEDGSLLLTGLKPGSKNIYHYFIDLRSEGREIPLQVDGHPSFIDNTSFLSDTYPNATGHQSLFISDLNGDKKTLASFYLPPNYTGEMRCDLHPRLSPDKTLCAVDIVKNGKRAIAILPVKQ